MISSSSVSISSLYWRKTPAHLRLEKNGRIMFINTPKFKFLDVLNYLGPGITYEKWVKTYGATLAKSWLPYEWFDSPDKLDFPACLLTWLGIPSSRVSMCSL